VSLAGPRGRPAGPPHGADHARARHRRARHRCAGEEEATTGPEITLLLASGGRFAETALDVVGTRDGGALVLMAVSSPERVTRLVRVSPRGARTGSLAVPGLASGWNLHLLPGGAAVVTGRLAHENAVGFAVVDPATGLARTVAAVPLESDTGRAVGDSAVSPDGRKVWLYSSMLLDARYRYLVSGHDPATGGLLVSRELEAELRGLHAPDQQLDLVGLGSSPDGGVLLVVNAFATGREGLWSPLLLRYDAALRPLGDPVALAPAGAGSTARALAMSADGTAFVLLRGWPVNELVAVPPGGGVPEQRLELTGASFTDELVLDTRGRAVLPGPAGARAVDLGTGATSDIDVGCASTVSLRELVPSAGGGTWVLGGCLEDGARPSVLWRVP
jgi:hypothetical protein